MSNPLVRRAALIAACAVALVSCGSGDGSDGPRTLRYVGRIPGVLADGSAVTVDGVRAELPLLDGEVLGPRSEGNRLLVIGDSIFESTSRRYGGEMCGALVPLGWRVAVEAKAGELVGFGRRVLEARLGEGWDAAVVFLGTNFGGTQQNYEADLTRIVESLSPRPTLLLTATLFRDSMKLVNESIRRVASLYPNVAVLDWGTASVQPGLLNRDNIHPTDAGRAVLAAAVASAVGNAPRTPGSCLMSMSDLPVDETDTTTTMPDGGTDAGSTTIPGTSATTVAPPGTAGQ